jgi:hypothetical protein
MLAGDNHDFKMGKSFRQDGRGVGGLMPAADDSLPHAR